MTLHFYSLLNDEDIFRLPPGIPPTATELGDLRQRLKGKQQALLTNKKILQETGSWQPDGGAKLRECIQKIEVRWHLKHFKLSIINLSIINLSLDFTMSLDITLLLMMISGAKMKIILYCTKYPIEKRMGKVSCSSLNQSSIMSL